MAGDRILADGDLGAVHAPALSVIIVSWNSWPVIDACLRTLLEQDLPETEIIVVDNNSTDDTPRHIRDRYPMVDLHRFPRNEGHTKAVNQGLQISRGEFVFVLDHDIEFLPHCVARLMSFLRERPDVSMVAPRTFNTDGSVQESARAMPSPMSALFGRQSTLTSLWPNNPFSRAYLMRDNLDAHAPFRVEQVGAACMLFRRDVIAKAGLWDESYFGYWVDTDWCYRLKSLGLAIYCVPEAQIFHHEGNARHKRKSAQRIWMFHYGAWRLYTRWRTFGRLDPRSILAGLGLGARALVQLALNATKPQGGVKSGAAFSLTQAKADGERR